MRHDGLPRQRWIEPIESFAREHGRMTPRWAVICTYECDISLLDRYVLPALMRRGRPFRTVVLADAGTLERQLQAAHAPRGRVNLHGIRLQGRGVFHPKLVLLRAGAAARVCFGSANLSCGGFGASLELWSHADDEEIVAAVVEFLSRLAAHPRVTLDPACRRQLNRAVVGLPQAPSPRVWCSLDETFADRLRSSKAGARGELRVISPALASRKGLETARSIFPQQRATVYTNEHVVIPGAAIRVYNPPMRADNEEVDVPEYPVELHAKVYLFRDGRQGHAWVGSANFTAQALSRAAANGGNVECLVRVDVPEDEMNALAHELDAVFEKPKGRPLLAPAAREDIPVARSNIIGCELSEGGGGLRLTVHAKPGVKEVTLEHDGRRATILIRGSRGVLEGEALQRAFPNLTADGPAVLVIQEILGRCRVPVVVNVPYVPDPDGSGPNQAGLDAFLDDLRGYLPRPPREDEESDEGDSDESESQNDGDLLDRDLGHVQRRLDEVRHQGELDRLAVKVALVRRLILRSTTPGPFRAELLAHALAASEQGCPAGLRSILKEWFG